MTGRFTLAVAALLAIACSHLLIAADAALEKTIEKAKEKRTAEIEKAGTTYHATVDKANNALSKALEQAIAAAKRKKDDAKVETLTKDLESVKAGTAPAATETGDKLLDGSIKRRSADIEQAEKTFKAAVDRANATLEATYNSAIAGYKRKSDARADELTTELATIKSTPVTPTKGEAAESKANGHQELIRTLGDTLMTSDNKKVASKAIAGKEYVLVYFSASWCGPCRAFTPKLVEFHNKHSKQAKFEVLLVGSDRSEQDMLNYMSGDKMPWLGVPFGSQGGNALQVKHNVRGIPALVAYDKDGNVISTAGAGAGQVLEEFKQKLGIKG